MIDARFHSTNAAKGGRAVSKGSRRGKQKRNIGIASNTSAAGIKILRVHWPDGPMYRNFRFTETLFAKPGPED